MTIPHKKILFSLLLAGTILLLMMILFLLIRANDSPARNELLNQKETESLETTQSKENFCDFDGVEDINALSIFSCDDAVQVAGGVSSGKILSVGYGDVVMLGEMEELQQVWIIKLSVDDEELPAGRVEVMINRKSGQIHINELDNYDQS
jgi:hypothetical protein